MKRLRKSPSTFTLLLPILAVAGFAAVVFAAARSPVGVSGKEVGAEIANLKPTVLVVDRTLAKEWKDVGATPAAAAPDLLVLRRLSLALFGMIPSLEEIRSFEADTRPDRLDHWTRRMLADPRFNDYFAERLARMVVGTEGGQFIIYRRDRFVEWLSRQLKDGVPWDQTVHSMLTQQGLSTDRPAVNFVAAAINEGDIDENKLAGRTARAFLGQRMDCAQCHDHPFAVWKQEQFEGLASFFGQTKQTITGVEDMPVQNGVQQEYKVQDRKTLKDRVVEPRVPFHSEWMPKEGSRREKLAAWITHPENRRFERAIANRVWGFVYGKPYLEPVDDLEDPKDGETDMLDVLGKEFREKSYDLRRLVQTIVSSKAFRTSSEPPAGADEKATYLSECHWAVFPLIRLRPEQVIGSMLQSSSVQTVDYNSNLLFRLIRITRRNDFVKEYGDFGDDELQLHGGTIPQRLLMMNGQLAAEVFEAGFFNPTSRLSVMNSSDEKCVENAYLVCLTRRPNPEESIHFSGRLKDLRGGERQKAVEDMMWSLVNSTEFSWNH